MSKTLTRTDFEVRMAAGLSAGKPGAKRWIDEVSPPGRLCDSRGREAPADPALASLSRSTRRRASGATRRPARRS
jgi:hypothetical protein